MEEGCADPIRKDESGRTPYSLAVEKKQLLTARWLLEEGYADPAIRDRVSIEIPRPPQQVQVSQLMSMDFAPSAPFEQPPPRAQVFNRLIISPSRHPEVLTSSPPSAPPTPTPPPDTFNVIEKLQPIHSQSLSSSSLRPIPAEEVHLRTDMDVDEVLLVVDAVTKTTGKYASALRENGVDGSALLSCRSEEEVRELGLTVTAHVRKLFAFIEVERAKQTLVESSTSLLIRTESPIGRDDGGTSSASLVALKGFLNTTPDVCVAVAVCGPGPCLLDALIPRPSSSGH